MVDGRYIWKDERRLSSTYHNLIDCWHRSTEFKEIMTTRFDGLMENPIYKGYFDEAGNVTLELIKQVQWLVDHPTIQNIPEWQRREIFNYGSTHVGSDSVMHGRVNIRNADFSNRNDVEFKGNSYNAHTNWYDRKSKPYGATSVSEPVGSAPSSGSGTQVHRAAPMQFEPNPGPGANLVSRDDAPRKSVVSRDREQVYTRTATLKSEWVAQGRPIGATLQTDTRPTPSSRRVPSREPHSVRSDPVGSAASATSRPTSSYNPQTGSHYDPTINPPPWHSPPPAVHKPSTMLPPGYSSASSSVSEQVTFGARDWREHAESRIDNTKPWRSHNKMGGWAPSLAPRSVQATDRTRYPAPPAHQASADRRRQDSTGHSDKRQRSSQ